MKYHELIKQLQKQGWYLLRQGGNHEIWTNGREAQPVPRHKELGEMTAKKILKMVRKSPGSQK